MIYFRGRPQGVRAQEGDAPGMGTGGGEWGAAAPFLQGPAAEIYAGYTSERGVA